MGRWQRTRVQEVSPRRAGTGDRTPPGLPWVAGSGSRRRGTPLLDWRAQRRTAILLERLARSLWVITVLERLGTDLVLTEAHEREHNAFDASVSPVRGDLCPDGSWRYRRCPVPGSARDGWAGLRHGRSRRVNRRTRAKTCTNRRSPETWPRFRARAQQSQRRTTRYLRK